jgi:formiminotetrahydrofolate cyclodeaminase
VRDETIESFLTQLAARVPAPGGGATAALHAAQAAALLAMVARYSDGPRYDAVLMGRITAEADGLRDHALRWASEDAAAFSAVAEAYRLPRDSADRPAAIAVALVGAAGPPVSVMHAALRLTALAAELAPVCNPSVVTDVGAAAAAARAAAVTSALNIEVNLKGITDPPVRASLAATAAQADAIAARADQVVAAVRAGLAS